MKIAKTTMSGFRGATAPVEITFDTAKSVALIFGENGTGKSTIADAFDFLCNGSYGSLENYSLGEPAKKYLPSLGTTPSAVKVALSSDSSTWVATLGKDGRVVVPEAGYPDAHILRRKTILKLIEAQPKSRFEELKTFIAVPKIEKSEEALREAVRTTEDGLNESTRALTQAKEGLDELWAKEGKPNTDALTWAKAEAAKDITQLQTNVEEIEKIDRAFSAAKSALSSLDGALAEQKKLLEVLADAEQKQKEAEAGQTQQNADLLKLLQEATAYIEPRQTLAECPVCEQKVKRADLLRRLSDRINDMHDLKRFVDQTTKARRDVESKTSVINQAQKDLCVKVKEVGLLLKPCTLAEIATLGLNWDNFEELFHTLMSLMLSKKKHGHSTLPPLLVASHLQIAEKQTASRLINTMR
jgi:DNA repair exonuclease SbcCD ATPase subunit